MAVSISELTAGFGAEISGVRLAQTLDPGAAAEIQQAIDRYAVLVFRGQPLDDEQQIEFSQNFGPLEKTMTLDYKDDWKRAEISDISNVDNKGRDLPPDHRKVIFNKGNEYWHTDSSFKPVPAKYSLLSAREIPPEGGDTEYADARAAYDTWPGSAAGTSHAELEELICEHSIVYSRRVNTGDIFSDKEKKDWPTVRQAMVRTHPATQRKSLYAGSHCAHVVGWPAEKGRTLIDELNAWVTQPRFIYRHRWQVGDLVMWDNRMVLHRGRPFDAKKFRRVMHRTTVAGDGPTAP